MNIKILIALVFIQLGISIFQARSLMQLTEQKTEIKAKLDHSRMELTRALAKDCR